MSTSEKQIQANRENAKKGGVKTETGKSISRLNALKHGVLSKDILLACEDEELLDSMEKGVIKELKPKGELEAEYAGRIVSYLWRFRRVAIAERAAVEHQIAIDRKQPFEDPYEFEGDDVIIMDHLINDTTELLLRYETTISRQLSKLLAEFREFQRIRLDSEQQKLP